jgi:two-component system sensor histidine kinase/response regulator
MKSSENILVVEDNAMLRDQIVQALQMEGYDVTAATNGREALRLVHTTEPSLVVSDITMPEMDGHELLRQLRGLPGHISTPVVFLTARVGRDAVRAGMNLGADDYLTKPFAMDELLQAINTRLLRRTQAGDAATEAVTQERGRMMLKMPHELRTPLTGIVGFAELMRGQLVPGQPCPTDLHEMLDGILQSSERLERLATNLVLNLHLEVARCDPEQRLVFIDSGPAAVNDQTVAVAERLAVAHGRLPDLQWRSDGSVAVAFSPHFLEKVLSEIIDNAFKFSKPGSPVTVEVKLAAERVEIAVTDRGLGITVEEAAQMAPFQQWQRASREQQGLGLGFAIARQLLQFNGCALEIGPRGGGGASVRLSLPIANV